LKKPNLLVRNNINKTPFELASSVEIRKIFEKSGLIEHHEI